MILRPLGSLLRSTRTQCSWGSRPPQCPFHCGASPLLGKGRDPIPPRPTINEADITESFLKGSGPGGQKINKTSSAVQLIHHPTGLVQKSQETRSRSQNRKIARRLLAEKVENLEKGGESRVAMKIERKKRKKASKVKKAKRKYRALEEGGEEEEEVEVEEEEGGVEGGVEGDMIPNSGERVEKG